MKKENKRTAKFNVCIPITVGICRSLGADSICISRLMPNPRFSFMENFNNKSKRYSKFIFQICLNLILRTALFTLCPKGTRVRPFSPKQTLILERVIFVVWIFVEKFWTNYKMQIIIRFKCIHIFVTEHVIWIEHDSVDYHDFINVSYFNYQIKISVYWNCKC